MYCIQNTYIHTLTCLNFISLQDLQVWHFSFPKISHHHGCVFFSSILRQRGKAIHHNLSTNFQESGGLRKVFIGHRQSTDLDEDGIHPWNKLNQIDICWTFNSHGVFFVQMISRIANWWFLGEPCLIFRGARETNGFINPDQKAGYFLANGLYAVEG